VVGAFEDPRLDRCLIADRLDDGVPAGFGRHALVLRAVDEEYRDPDPPPPGERIEVGEAPRESPVGVVGTGWREVPVVPLGKGRRRVEFIPWGAAIGHVHDRLDVGLGERGLVRRERGDVDCVPDAVGLDVRHGQSRGRRPDHEVGLRARRRQGCDRAALAVAVDPDPVRIDLGVRAGEGDGRGGVRGQILDARLLPRPGRASDPALVVDERSDPVPGQAPGEEARRPAPLGPRAVEEDDRGMRAGPCRKHQRAGQFDVPVPETDLLLAERRRHPVAAGEGEGPGDSFFDQRAAQRIPHDPTLELRRRGVTDQSQTNDRPIENDLCERDPLDP